MHIAPLTKEEYKTWDSFCDENDGAWFWHTSGWLEYTLNYRPSLKTENTGFFVHKGDAVKAIVPLTIETYEKNGTRWKEFSFGGDAIPGPVVANDTNRVIKDRLESDLILDACFAETDRLAKEYGVVRSRFREAPLSPLFQNENKPFNYFTKWGYLDISLATQLIDLERTEDELWNDMRRNHKRNVKKGKEKGVAITVYTKENITPEIFEAYKEMHHKAAGRRTRPDYTFNLMYKWIQDGLSFLTVAKYKDKQVGFEYYTEYKDAVYGFSVANDPDCDTLPIRHVIEWEAIRWMKQSGFQKYEIGLQQFGPLPYDFPSDKERAISHFKRGFGGKTVPLFRAEKYYDKHFFEKTWEERGKKYADFIQKQYD